MTSNVHTYSPEDTSKKPKYDSQHAQYQCSHEFIPCIPHYKHAQYQCSNEFIAHIPRYKHGQYQCCHKFLARLPPSQR